MKRFMYSAAIAMACTIAVAAQAPTADQSKKEPMAKDAAKSVTATGCVAEADGHFMLNNATMTDQTGAPMSYALSGGTLKPHVGHKVEITGTMKPAATSGMKKDTMAKDKGGDMKDAKKDDMASSPTLNVKEVKMVAASCS